MTSHECLYRWSEKVLRLCLGWGLYIIVGSAMGSPHLLLGLKLVKVFPSCWNPMLSIGCPLDAKAWGFSWGILFDGEGYTFLYWAVLFLCICWLVSPFRHIICKCLSYSSGCLLFLLFLLLFTSLVCWYPSSHFLLLFSILLMSYPKTSLPVLMY